MVAFSTVVRTAKQILKEFLVLGEVGEGSRCLLALHPSVGMGLGRVIIEPLDQTIDEIHSVAYFRLSFNNKGMSGICKLGNKNIKSLGSEVGQNRIWLLDLPTTSLWHFACFSYSLSLSFFIGKLSFVWQNCWDSLVAQMVKNLPTTWKAWIWLLGREDPLEN